jgi:hypothetical protein
MKWRMKQISKGLKISNYWQISNRDRLAETMKKILSYMNLQNNSCKFRLEKMKKRRKSRIILKVDHTKLDRKSSESLL